VGEATAFPRRKNHRATKNVSDVGADVGQSYPIMLFQVSFGEVGEFVCHFITEGL